MITARVAERLGLDLVMYNVEFTPNAETDLKRIHTDDDPPVPSRGEDTRVE